MLLSGGVAGVFSETVKKGLFFHETGWLLTNCNGAF